MAVLPTRIQLARYTAAQWASANPVLLQGEPGWEIDSGNLKIGNGTSTWNTLPYFGDSADSPQVTLNGTTAGTAVSSQPFQGATFKKFVVYLNGYRNSTAGAQTINYPLAFLKTPRVVADDAGILATATTLTLPVSMTGAVTGWIILEGY